MDKFVQFEPPSPAVEKKGFFARLFGVKEAESPNTSPPQPAANIAHNARPSPQPVVDNRASNADPVKSVDSTKPSNQAHTAVPTLNPQRRPTPNGTTAVPTPNGSAPKSPSEPVRTTTLNTATPSKEIPQASVKVNRSAQSAQRRVAQQAKSGALSSGEIGLLDKLRMRRNDKQQKEFWMRDESVTNCYGCQVSFSVLVRKHHCRLCGQIFCHKCTENNVMGELLGYNNKGAVRVCNFCFNLLQNPNLREEVKPKSPLATTPTLPNVMSEQNFRRINDPLSSPRDKSDANMNNINNNNSLIDELADPQEEELLSRTYTRIAFSGYHLHDKHNTNDPAPIVPFRDGAPGTSPDDFTLMRADHARAEHSFNDDRLYMSSPESGFGSLERGHYADRPSPPLDPLTSPPSEIPYLHQLNGVDVRTIDQYLSKKMMTPRVDKTIKYRNRMSRARLDVNDMVQAFKTMFNPSEGATDTTDEHQEKLMVQRFYHTLEKDFEQHLRRLTKELIEREDLDPSWINVVIHLARSACNNVKPHVRDGDSIDIRRYIKIKKIAGGVQSDCQSVDGVVFTKNRTNKQMKAEFVEPKILLLNCALEYERNARLSSFDSLLAQEKEYLRILVHKVTSVRPDIVIVAKNVSRLAQEFMLDDNVCLELNIKPNIMHIIARITRGDLLASTEHVQLAQMGTCGRFRIQTYKLPDGSVKPCTYLESCPRDLFCTLVIRGDQDAVLAKVKRVLQFVCYAVYDMTLELKLIADTYIDEVAHQAPAGTVVPGSNGPNEASTGTTSESADPGQQQGTVDKKSTGEIKFIEDRCLSTSPSVKFAYQSPKLAKDPHVSGPAVPAVYPILRRRPVEPNLYTCSHSHLINNIINNIMLSNDYNSSYTSYEPIYTKDGDDPAAIDSTYRDYYNSTSDKNKKTPRSDAAASNTAVPGPASEVRTISRRNPFGIEFNYRCVLAAIEQQYSLPTLNERRIESTQNILYLHSLFCHKTMSNCIPQELHYLDFYSSNDMTLGQFLELYCFNTRLKCRARDCNRDMLDHERSFFHYRGRLNVAVKNWRLLDKTPLQDMHLLNDQIYAWQQCKVCKLSSHQVVPLAEESWRYSFGKYLENSFYGESPKCPTCQSSIWRDYVKYFYCNDSMVVFEYEPITLMDVVVPSLKPIACQEDGTTTTLRAKEIDTLQREIMITYEEVGLQLALLKDSAGKLLEQTDQQEAYEELDHMYEMTARENGMFADRIGDMRNKADARDSFDVNACKKVLLGYTVTWLSTLTEMETKIQRKLMRPLMRPAAKKEPGQTSPQPPPKDATPPLSGVHHSLSSSSTISTHKVTTHTTADLVAAPKEVHELNFDRQPHIARTHRRSTSMPGGLTREMLQQRLQHETLVEQLEDSPPNALPAQHANSEPVPVPTLTLEQPSEQTQTNVTLNTVGSALGTVLAAQNSPSSESVVPPLSLSNTSVPKPGTADEKGPVGKRLLDTISNIFAADKKTFSVLEDVTTHYFLPPCVDNTVLPIYETELSSFVAYTLMSAQYRQSVAAVTAKEINKEPTSSNVTTPQASTPNSIAVSAEIDKPKTEDSTVHADDALKASATATNASASSVPPTVAEDPNKERDEILKGLTTSFNSTVDCHFKQDYNVGQTIKVKLQTTVYFAQHFEWLRRLIGVDERQFIVSMSRSKIWDAKGGKSRSWFSKTLDDRWILKGIAAVELESFLQFAPQYFDYLSKVYFQQVPTALAKIVGIYSVVYKRGSKSLKQDFLVMENLFYKRSISKIYDLKGSLRSRYVDVEEEKAEGPVVLLDENLLETIYSNPICVREEAKATLGMTIWNDTLFLSSLNVMDYSLLVGVDEEKNELVVGIIDYMRRYTWDKQLETWVKRSGFLGEGNKVPTIISPKQYKKRFRSALWLYFPMVPSKETNVVVAESGNSIRAKK